MAKATPEKAFKTRLGMLVAKGGTNGRMSANAFAQKCGLTSSRRVSDWLEGGKRMPNAENLRGIGEAFGVSVDWLLGFDVPMMRGTAMEKADLELELALHVEHAIAVEVRGQPYAFHLATRAIDGAELLKTVISVQLKRIEEAWLQASVYTKSGVRLLTEATGPPSKGEKRQRPTLEHLAFQAAIFTEALERRSGILRSSSRLSRKGHTRPLLELARDASPVNLRRRRG